MVTKIHKDKMSQVNIFPRCAVGVTPEAFREKQLTLSYIALVRITIFPLTPVVGDPLSSALISSSNLIYLENISVKVIEKLQ